MAFKDRKQARRGTAMALALIGASSLGVNSPALAAQVKGTWGRTIGTLCFERVPDSARKDVATANDNGVEVTHFKVNYVHKAGTPWPIVRVFSEVPERPHPLATCSELTGPIVFEGSIERMSIQTGRETAPGEAKAVFYLPQQSMEIELVRAKAVMQLYGGTMQLGRSADKRTSGRAWIRNQEAIAAEAGQPAQGRVALESWGRELVGARLVLPGTGTASTLDLHAGNSNTTVLLPLGGGAASFLDGRFSAARVPFAAANAVFPGVEFDTFAGTAGEVALLASKGKVAFEASNITYSATSARFAAPHSTVASAAGKGAIVRMTASAGSEGDAIALADLQVAGLHNDAGDCHYRYDGLALADSSLCKVVLARANASGQAWRFETSAASLPFAPGVVRSAGHVLLNSTVDGGAERFDGVLQDASVRLGALGLQQQRLALGNPEQHEQRVRIPFAFAAAPATGTWSLALPDGALAVEGTLEEASARGAITLDPADGGAWALDVARDDLAFKGKVSLSHQPWLYGAKPGFGAVGLAFRSASDVHVAKAGATGAVYARADVLVLADPVIALGEAQGGMVLSGPQRFEGAVGLHLDLASGKTGISDGLLHVVKARLTTRPGLPGDLGNIRMQEGEAAFEELRASFERGTGAFSIKGVTLKAARLASRPAASDESGANQLAWSGVLKDGSAIASISGDIVQESASGALNVDNVVVSNATLGLADIRMGQGRSLRFSGGDLALNLERWADQDPRAGLVLTDSRLASSSPTEHGKFDVNVGIKSFEAQITGGTLAALSGTARLLTTTLQLQTDTSIEIRESCDGKPDFQGVPARASVASGPIALALSIDGGALKGQGSAQVTHAAVRSTGGYECRARIIDWVISKERRAYYNYPCPTWRKPLRMCDGWTKIAPEISVGFSRVIKVRSLDVAGMFSVMSLKLDGTDKVSACGKAGAMLPLADISYYIKPNSSIPILDDVIDAVTDFTARPFSSALLSGIGALAGAILPNTPDGLCM